jgi:hypothetical protein
MSKSADLTRFYSLLATLQSTRLQPVALGSCSGKSCRWPKRGVYFFTEPGEYRRDDTATPRVVRVGTHAVGVGSKSTFWGRLRAHRGTRDGRGDHRGSIFRLHVGNALLASTGHALPLWGIGRSAKRETKESETEHERRVTAYLAKMRVSWIEVADDSGPESDRSLIERNAIALLSNRMDPVDRPSPTWLGLSSSRPEIVASGLWNLDYVNDEYAPTFLDKFEHYVSQTLNR